MQNRLDQIEKELQRIRNLYERALSYQDQDPETALMHARKVAEAVCRHLFVRHISPKPKELGLEGLIEQLSVAELLPKRILIPLQTIQRYGNFAAHAQDAEVTGGITPDYVQPCLQALTVVVGWYFAQQQADGHGTQGPVVPAPRSRLGRDAYSQAVTAELVTLSEQMFRWWRRVRDGTLTRATFRRKMAPARERIEWLILDGTQTRTKAVRAMCWELHRLSAAMWTFIDVEGIDPTNNAAERAVRAAVLWRKCSYGTHSEAGAVFAERMLTVTASLRMQSRNVLAYLTHAVEASLSGQAAPSLLPGRDHVTPLANAA